MDPKDLIDNFSNILSAKVIATKVQMKVKLHKGLEFRNELPQNLSSDKTIMSRDLGNVTEDTEVTFEYKLKSIKELVKMVDIDLTKIKSLPFQAQITYSTLEGSRCVRVITYLKESSFFKEVLEKDAYYEVLGLNAIQQTAKMAKQGDYKNAQIYSKAWDQRLGTRITHQSQA